MFTRTASKGQTLIAGEGLELQAADGRTLCAFSDATVRNLRRMSTHLMYQSMMPRTLACVATLREEGVTYTTVALGLTLAHDLAASVCVVELNWWTPGLEQLLGGRSGDPPRKRKAATAEKPAAPMSPGLAAVVQGRATLDEALVPTARPNFMLLPAGTLDIGQRTAMARNGVLAEQIAVLRRRFDYVLMDLPAIALTSDAIALASLSEAAVIVVRQAATPITATQAAVDEIKHLKLLGVIMNRVTTKTPRWIVRLLPQE
jgi:Mrp family chromosome partitioning ATPase